MDPPWQVMAVKAATITVSILASYCTPAFRYIDSPSQTLQLTVFSHLHAAWNTVTALNCSRGLYAA
jgi:hypothetical protein